MLCAMNYVQYLATIPSPRTFVCRARIPNRTLARGDVVGSINNLPQGVSTGSGRPWEWRTRAAV